MKPFIAIISLEQHDQGRARTQSPTTRNYAIEIPTFGEFARVSNSLSAMAEPRYGWTNSIFQFLGVYLSQAQSYILQHGFMVKTHSKVKKQNSYILQQGQRIQMLTQNST